jgi:hypothetical protein
MNQSLYAKFFWPIFILKILYQTKIIEQESYIDNH